MKTIKLNKIKNKLILKVKMYKQNVKSFLIKFTKKKKD